jgi:hypothetical protein
MTGAIRNWWWLVGGALAMAVGVVLIATVGAVGTCSDFGVLYEGSAVPPVTPCQESIDTAQRNWIVGSALLLVGLATVAYDVGYRRGHRASSRDGSGAKADS